MADKISTRSILSAVKECNGSKAAAARLLKCNVQTIYRRIKDRGLQNQVKKLDGSRLYKVTMSELKTAIAENNGHLQATADQLGINVRTIWKRSQRHPKLKTFIHTVRRNAKEKTYEEHMQGMDARRSALMTTPAGQAYEKLFSAKTLLLGHYPHPTPAECLAHDSWVLNNRQDKGYYVQIRGTSRTLYKGDSYSVNADFAKQFLSKDGTGKHTGDAAKLSKIDIFAAYVLQEDVWYLIPIKEVTSKTIRLCPHNPLSSNKYEQFKNNWDIFK
tara:strand:- start:223 stop:1041 length:819 start_codon:yes stop_codon:yes gene_type:complete